MRHSFEKVISTNFLQEFVDQLSAKENKNVQRFNYISDKYENELVTQLSARQFIDLIIYTYSLLEKKHEESHLQFFKISNLSWFRGLQKSSKLKKSSPTSEEKTFIDFSEEEEDELLRFLFRIKYDVRTDYDLMDRIHRFINHVFGYRFPYSDKTDPKEKQSDNKEKFIKHSFEVLKKYNPNNRPKGFNWKFWER